MSIRIVNIFIISGPPGVGKTRHAELYAQQRNMALVYYQCHAWTDADEFFFGVNVQAAVSGEGKVRQPGVLAIAAESSKANEILSAFGHYPYVTKKE